MIHSKLEINGNEIIKYNVNTGSMMETKLIDLSVELDADLFIEYGYNKIADMNLTTNNNIGLKMNYLKGLSKEAGEHCHGVYLIVINGKVVKIGGTETGLRARWGSYGNGTDKIRNGAANGSVTNYYVCTAIKEALKLGYSVEWYYKKMKYEVKLLNLYGIGITENVCVDGTYKMHEKALLELYKNKTGKYPKLSSNA